MYLHNSEEFLKFLALRNPYIWEVIGGGPLGRRDWASLNPQPLPPMEIGEAVVSILFERSAVAGSYARFAEDVDDWCGTGWPHRIPKPKPGPRPWEIFLGGAVAATELAHSIEGKEADLVSGAAQQLFEQARQVAR